MLLKTIHKIVSTPRVYDISQNLIGAKINRDILRKELEALTPFVHALDVGSGTGLNRPLIPHNWNYCCLDSDIKKLKASKQNFLRTNGWNRLSAIYLCQKKAWICVS